MCKCRYTVWDLIESVNKKRKHEGLEDMPYETFMSFYRSIRAFIPPDERIGCSYIFRKGKAKRIVESIWKKPYRSHQSINWFCWQKTA